MRRFLILVTLFLAIMVLLDRIAGFTFNYFSEHSKGGYIAHHNYILGEMDSDIVIFGSSRAIRHYNPQVISDSLNLSCYNCGQTGNGIILFYGWWKLIKERTHPKYIIYDITPSFDLLVSEDNHKYLGWLKQHYDFASIRSIFEDIDSTEKFKMISQMYRYNSSFLQITSDFIHPIYKVRSNGFAPLEGALDSMRIKDDYDSLPSQILFDSLKISYLEKFIDDLNGAKLVFTVSPMWYGLNEEELVPIRDICKINNIEFIDFSNNPKYVHNNRLFKDGLHLNAFGADVYTRDLVTEMKKRNILFY